MTRILEFIFGAAAAMIAIPVIKEVLTNMDLASVPNIQEHEIAMWGLLPLLLLITIIIVGLGSVYLNTKKDDKEKNHKIDYRR